MWKSCRARVRAFYRGDSGMTTAQYAIVMALLVATFLTAASRVGKRTKKAINAVAPAAAPS